MMETRNTLFGFTLFWGNIIGIPTTIIIMTILQIHANQQALEKEKRDFQ